jgi:hypothetical protein
MLTLIMVIILYYFLLVCLWFAFEEHAMKKKVYIRSQKNLLKHFGLPVDAEIIDIIPNIPLARNGIVLNDRAFKIIVRDFSSPEPEFVQPWYERFFNVATRGHLGGK